MSFNVSADAYAQFMGRYSEPLAAQFVDLVAAHNGQRALDVGSGPGGLTAQLVDRLGADAVAAIDPSPPFVEALRRRLPGVDVRAGSAEQLPFPDAGFDLTLAQLVVHFMTEPVAGLAEMARVTRPGGLVAASVWDHSSGGGPLSTFWQAVAELYPDAHDESGLAGVREGHLAELFDAAGLKDISSTSLTVTVPYETYDAWWAPYTMGVGPAGAYVAGLDEAQREALRERCERLLPAAPFDIVATAWCATGRPA